LTDTKSLRTEPTARGSSLLLLLWLVGGLLISLGGCSSMGRQQTEGAPSPDVATSLPAPSQAPQDEVLPLLSTLEPDRPVLLASGLSARAAAVYHAASGRPCRVVVFSNDAGESERWLACRDGTLWTWVPDVLP
jgi:hypothetical protein